MTIRKHPLTELLRYLIWLLMIASTHHPGILLLCLITVWGIQGKAFWKSIPLDVLMVAVTIGINVLTNHGGETYLFYLNDNIVTLESIVYGGILGLQIVLLIHISAIFSRRMTADKIVIVTGSLSPSLAILISMAIRNVERYHRKIQEIYRYQKCESRSEHILERLFLSIRTVSIMVNWALENGLEVADSMISRGYQSGRRTSYSPVRFLGQDGMECICLLLFVLLWEWGQPFTILIPYIRIGICGWWFAMTAAYMGYVLVEEKYEDRYQKKNNIRAGDSARCIPGDW
ncbi:MAG: energy-coupling factor transporter transmembrane protein EcfT [Lachnospiraceae bacterium]|nr:energy-coupling factor transporter transmembrane protein EcfT [Lachnospiraceae bacterium]